MTAARCSILSALLAFPLLAAPAVTLSATPPSSAPVGAMVAWTAAASDAAPGALTYRFRASRAGRPFQIIRDYGPEPTLDWTLNDHEGTLEVEVSVRNRSTGETAEATSTYEFTSRVTGDTAVVSPTTHPLVFLYSAPPCRRGARIRVLFRVEGEVRQSTPLDSCDPLRSTSFYLAGLRPNTEYSALHVIDTGFRFVESAPTRFQTGSAPDGLARPEVLQFPDPARPSRT